MAIDRRDSLSQLRYALTLVAEAVPALGLRERKKARARADLEAVALRLFAAQGYDETTVDEIARGAELSPATFFRYFRSKEEVVFAFQQEYGDEVARIVDEEIAPGPVDAARLECVIARFAAFLDDDPLFRVRTELVVTNRTLQARSLLGQAQWEHRLADALALNAGHDAPDTHARAAAALAYSVLYCAARVWAATGYGQGLKDLVAETMNDMRSVL